MGAGDAERWRGGSVHMRDYRPGTAELGGANASDSGAFSAVCDPKTYD